MHIFTLPLGDYQTNCYLVSDETGQTAVIDPGYAPEKILAAAQQNRLHICAVLLTHAHFDHVGAVRGLAQATACPVWLNEKELRLPEYLTAGPLYYTDCYQEGNEVAVGALRFSVLETPGHTLGSVCLRCGDALFSGDTLFAGSCGRTDLGGSAQEMRRSLARLAGIPENLNIYPGHGEATTLDAERARNPYLKEAVR